MTLEEKIKREKRYRNRSIRLAERADKLRREIQELLSDYLPIGPVVCPFPVYPNPHPFYPPQGTIILTELP